MANSSTSICCAFEGAILDQVLPPILFLEFMFGLMGNCLVLWAVMFHMDIWKPSSVYLTHLAVADTLVLFCLPVRADYYLRGKNWIHGDILCRLLLFLLACNRLAGIFFLTAAAVDRYLRIVHPRNRINQMGLRYAQGVSCSLWLLILTMTTYLLSGKHFFFQNNQTQCESFNICMGFDPLSTWHNVLYLVQYFLPATIITYGTIRITCKVRSKIDNQGKIKRAIQFVLVMALVFIFCFFPSTVSRVVLFVLKSQHNDCSYFRDNNLAFYILVCFTYFNSMLNPIIYYFSSPAFSRTFQNLFNRLLGGKRSQKKMATSKGQTTNSNQTTINHQVTKKNHDSSSSNRNSSA